MSHSVVADDEMLQGIRAFQALLQRKLPLTKADEHSTEDLDRVSPLWKSHMDYVLYSSRVLNARVGELGARISEDYKNAEKPLLCVGMLKGAFMFMTDLVKTLTVPTEVDFMALSSYGSGTESSGNVQLKKDLSINPQGRDVLIIEDICDTGGTFTWLLNYLMSKGCNSVKTVVLLSKSARRTKQVQLDYVGFDCPDEFVVGYGMDFNESYRSMPFVGVLKPEVFQKK